MNPTTAERYLYYVLRGKYALPEFEQWLYEHDELEEIFGTQEYLELISRDYKGKYAFHETEQQIRRLVHAGKFEQERIVMLLYELLNEEDASRQLQNLAVLYEEYCNGYSFLRYIALRSITTSDEFKERLKLEYAEYLRYMTPLKAEAERLLGFFYKKQLIIEEEHEYIDYRAESDRIELHSINEMF
ncbi:hypothetical protein C2I18_00930 [Paenibacillus sp. PK3_47]|nr:hypothetical protein C2I18_00930 [Paenibacillus sp. PK3_47]